MVTKNNQRIATVKKINYVFCYKQCLGVFSQAHNYRNVAITNSVPNQKKKITKQELCKHGPLQKLEIRSGGMEE